MNFFFGMLSWNEISKYREISNYTEFWINQVLLYYS
jgi:hypothetical protein